MKQFLISSLTLTLPYLTYGLSTYVKNIARATFPNSAFALHKRKCLHKLERSKECSCTRVCAHPPTHTHTPTPTPRDLIRMSRSRKRNAMTAQYHALPPCSGLRQEIKAIFSCKGILESNKQRENIARTLMLTPLAKRDMHRNFKGRT